MKAYITVGWFYCMAALVGLFYAGISLAIMVFNCIQHKNVFFTIILNPENLSYDKEKQPQ